MYDVFEFSDFGTLRIEPIYPQMWRNQLAISLLSRIDGCGADPEIVRILVAGGFECGNGPVGERGRGDFASPSIDVLGRAKGGTGPNRAHCPSR